MSDKAKIITIILTVLITAITGYANIENPHGDIKWACDACHTTESWKELKKDMLFEHNETGFSLIGIHETIGCRQCHSNLKFEQIGVECTDCHTDIHRGQFGADCQLCHTPQDRQDRVDILKTHIERGFPLLGVHAITDCDACHISQGRDEYAGTPINCEGCHIANFEAADNPNHSLASFSLDCRHCHLPIASSWQDNIYRHTDAFQLTGAHALIDCNSCHTQRYSGTSAICFACHEPAYNGAADPPHVSLGFPTECEVCHNQVRWGDAVFDHVQASDFELRGAHALIDCNACHADNNYDLPRDCFGCHQPDYQSTTDPDHAAGNFPTDCTMCHTESAWSPATFDHNITIFPLTGAHQTTPCQLCHINGQYAGTPADCWSCHENDYRDTNDPDHEVNNFSHDCSECHSTGGWDPATFNHDQTNFPLTGSHRSLNCLECHSSGYAGTPSDCWSCHENDYRGTNDPDHEANNFSHDCTECHNTNGWDTGVFNHNTTAFPLTGAHNSLNCITCHVDGYSNLPIDCWSCHEADYSGASDPDHAQNNFNHICTECHGTAAWQPATFDHNQTDFPLTGAHGTLNCLTCHSGGYMGTPTDCWSCHESDFVGVNDPNHVIDDFDHDCSICHNTSQWPTDIFNHNNTDFPLTGAHMSQTCAACHSTGYDNTPLECLACHEGDYNGASNPNHPAAGFPTTCEDCHNATRWDQTTWDHDTQYFPIYSGRHQNEWNLCADCHVNANDYGIFECILCHEHNRNDTDEHHLQVPGYVYESIACYNCHPDGNH